MGDNNSPIWITIVAIIILGGITLLLLYGDFDERPHSGYSTLMGIKFNLDRDVILEDSHLGSNESMNEELNRSKFILQIEIEETNISWAQEYYYTYWKEKDLLIRDEDNTTVMYFTNWSYDEVYTYTIKFLCISTNETVRNLPIFDKELYFQGSFVITEGRNDRVDYFDETKPFFMRNGYLPYVIYYGNAEVNGVTDDHVFFIRIYESKIGGAA